MKVLRISSFVLVLVLGVVLLSGSVIGAQDSNPEMIYRAAYDAFNAGDVDGGMALIADDVVGVLLPPPPGVDTAQTGKEPFRAVMEDAVAINMQWELNDFHVSGETASYKVSLKADDFLADFDVYPLEFTGFVVVRDGLIQAEVWSMDEDSRRKIDEAMTNIANEELVNRWLHLWDTVNGDMDDFDEIVSDDFVSHSMPEGDREAMRAGIEGFRADNPGAYFPLDDLAISDGKAYITNRMWIVPEDAEEGSEGEPVSPPFLLVLGLDDGQITERWLFVTPE